ncbi:lipid A biosynthesis lauroyl acyltransferase [Fulvivirga sp. M361]|uniref:lysophospholipid acyltransferase family protein n=1 Tax=Fulvivirga sp. M361 TaxID=2594266 RepID=UPI00117BA1D9|nr:lysophospholipid acyltransferase family protein [Fulvivirga sp. M361]TRX51611.1 lipid A biosynthesis lauroyl acyltransferase [Fulvivirga sp. M361]
MAKRSLKKRIKYSLIFAFVKTLIALANFFPRTWVMKFSGRLGRLAFRLMKKPSQITTDNLASVYGSEMSKDEIHNLGKKVFEMIGKNASDIIRGLSVKDYTSLEKFTVIEGQEHLDKAYARGKGVIALTAHYGAFEFTATYLGLKGYQPLVIGTALKDKRLNKLLVENRTSRGGIAIERGKETVKVIKGLKSGGVLIILIDQDTKVKSEFVDFMGRKASTPIGGTLMALKTGAAVVPMYVSLQADYKQKIRFLPEVELQTTGDMDRDLVVNTQRLTTVTEEIIREDPSQWVWMHRRWKTRPPSETQA